MRGTLPAQCILRRLLSGNAHEMVVNTKATSIVRMERRRCGSFHDSCVRAAPKTSAAPSLGMAKDSCRKLLELAVAMSESAQYHSMLVHDDAES